MPTSTSAPGMPIHFRQMTKTFGEVRAVDSVDLDVLPGRVTGLLGPNGSGKTTLLRMLLGLVRPDSGSATIGGRAYAEISRPGAVVGASLEASFHPGRKAVDHLMTLAPSIGASRARVDEVLGLVGLSDAAHRKVGGFSLGMRQRLGLAGTLLGDPDVLVLDEPANGLDPQGILWLRDLLRHLAREGRTVLVSSHILGEVQATVDDVAVLSRGRLVHASSLADMVQMADSHVRLAGPQMEGLAQLVTERGWVLEEAPASWVVRGASAAEVGAAAFGAGLELHALESVGANLEETFLKIVSGEVPGRIRPLEDAARTTGVAA